MFKKLFRITATTIVLLALSGISQSAETPVASAIPFTVDANFPGGNIIVDKIKANGSQAGKGQSFIVHLRPDLRDTPKYWFFWNFQVKSAQGYKIKFVFKPAVVGSRGPAVSVDEGKTWRWLSDANSPADHFVYTFAKNESNVRFCLGMYYMQSHWDRFIADYKNRPGMNISVLCKSRKNRDVELARFGNPDAKFGILLTCRHHSCEMVPNYALEGIIHEVFSGSDDGKWLMANVDFIVVPFVDKDGVEDGDQGKNRRPHDHNRDYVDEIYPEVRAIKALITPLAENKQFAVIDMHCPGCRGNDEVTYFYEPYTQKLRVQLREFCQILQKKQASGTMNYKETNNLLVGQGANKPDGKHKPIRCRYFGETLPNVLFSATLEIAYANAMKRSSWSSEPKDASSKEGSVVDANSTRELGRNVARALREYLGR
ncbi:MAG: M14 family zinc carboxypeptidase [Kiritimatiellae bacterium]|nr:M14 family zinc carboxypeptidase [Kiritimatiellia bacterium]MDD5520998.1 M14 family zinc carboxypeptidase [Kiritimatiellia bacterium]